MPLRHPSLSPQPHPRPAARAAQLRDTSERLGAQLDAVVEGYHTGFARSIQNYSQILALFAESKEQVDAMKHSLADAAKQLGAHSRFMSTQVRMSPGLADWRRAGVVAGCRM